MTISGEELAKIGIALYGDQWRENLARSLNVDSRRIPQWESGKRDIPTGVIADLLVLLKKNNAEITHLIIELENLKK